jgi:hypothetical protein
MAKTKISQYDATAANNTDIDSINIAEGMAPSNVNNAIRELMAHLKDMDAGTQALTSPQLTSADINGGTIDGVTIGGASAGAGTFTNLTATGTTTLAGASTSADITFGDNDKAIFGAGSDLQIYHDGSDSIIRDVGTGDLRLRGTSLAIEDSSGNEFIRCSDGGTGGTVFLKHLGAIKLATTSTGIDVTGDVDASSNLKVNGTLLVDSSMNLQNLNLVQVATGSSTAPSIRFTGDTNTGFARPAADTLGFITGGTERMRIDSSGNVGIGTSSPETILHATASSAIIRLTSDANGTSGVDFGDSADTNIGRLLYDNSDNSMRFTTNASEAMRIDSSGNVGIGTSSPSQKLDVNGSVNIPNDYSYGFGGAGSNTYISGNNASNNLRFNTNGSEAMRIDSSGNLLVGTTTTQNLGTVNSGSLIRDGYIQVASTDATATLAYFYSAAGQVGSIGVDNSDNLFIQGNSTHVGFQFASSAVVPHKNGATIDNNVNLGSASDRFKDLYLSGEHNHPCWITG